MMEGYYKERLYTNLKEFESSLNYIHALRERLMNTFSESFEYNNSDLMNETIDFISSIESIIQTLHSKIESILELYNMVQVLDNSIRILQLIKEDLSEIVPILESSLYDIAYNLLEIKAILKLDNNFESIELPFINDNINTNSTYRMLLE
jgi:sugar-specific transcriptional regulator TrmB